MGRLKRYSDESKIDETKSGSDGWSPELKSLAVPPGPLFPKHVYQFMSYLFSQLARGCVAHYLTLQVGYEGYDRMGQLAARRTLNNAMSICCGGLVCPLKLEFKQFRY